MNEEIRRIDIEALSLEITQRMVHDARAELISRKPKATPVLIRMETNGKGPTAGGDGQANGDGAASREKRVHVTFAAGTTQSPENEGLVRRLKSEFERLLQDVPEIQASVLSALAARLAPELV